MIVELAYLCEGDGEGLVMRRPYSFAYEMQRDIIKTDIVENSVYSKNLVQVQCTML